MPSSMSCWSGSSRCLQQGAVLVDEADESLAPRLLVYLEHAIRDGRVAKSGEPRVVSQRLQFIHLREDGAAVDGGSAPYLDCRPITAEERALVADQIDRALAFGPRRGPRAWPTPSPTSFPIIWPK